MLTELDTPASALEIEKGVTEEFKGSLSNTLRSSLGYYTIFSPK